MPVTTSHSRSAAGRSAGPPARVRTGTGIVEEQRRHPVPAGIEHPWWSARTSSCVVGSARAASKTSSGAPISESRRRATAGSCGLPPRVCNSRPIAAYQRSSRSPVTASQQRPDPHQRPAVGPLALPGVLLAFDPVHLFEAEEPPVDREGGLRADVADPQRCLVRERAHRVEMEIHGAHRTSISRVG